MRHQSLRRASTCAVLAFVSTLSACGGGGGGAPGGSALPGIPGGANKQSGASTGSPYDNLVISDGAAEYYRLDETSGTVAADASGHTVNGSYLGTPGVDYQLGQAPGPIAQEPQGWYASRPTSNPHGISAPAIAGATSSSSWTLEAWLEIAALPAAGRSLAIAGNSGSNRLLVASNGSLVYQNATGITLNSATALVAGRIYHVVLKSDLSAGTYGTVSFAINGVRDANSLAYPRTSDREGMNAPYYWGQYDASANYKWNGDLGRVAYYTTALSDQEIAKHYAAGIAVATPAPSPTPSSALPSPSPSGAPQISLPSGISSFSAQIYKYSGTQISVNPRPNCGHQNIPVGKSTLYFNGPVALEWAVFTGTNASCSSSFAASTVSLYSSQPASVSVSGSVVAATPYGFTLNAGPSGTAIPILLTSSSAIFGGQLVPGANVTVNGVGTTSVSIVANQVAVAAPTPNPSISPTPTPEPIGITHVMTGGYVYGYSGTPTTVPLSSIAPWQTWAYTDTQHAALLRAAGIKVTIYSIFWRNHVNDNPSIGYLDLKPGGAHAAAEAMDCSNTPLWDPTYGGGYAADARSSSALAHAQIVVNYKLGEYGSNYDTIFADETGSFDGMSTPCGYDEQSYDQAVNSVDSGLRVPMFINALGSKSPYALTLASPSNVVGAMCELCYGNNLNGTDGVDSSSHNAWQWVENAEISMAAEHKIFWDYARMSGDPSSETALRTYVYASLMLTYDPNYVMFEEAYPTPSGFPVMPEDGLVVMQPLTTSPTVDGYLAPGGAYFREFAACYYRGAFLSKCAIAVNPSPNSAAPVPTTSYFHSMTLSGSGVLDGGTVAFSGPQVTQLAPETAAILFP